MGSEQGAGGRGDLMQEAGGRGHLLQEARSQGQESSGRSGEGEEREERRRWEEEQNRLKEDEVRLEEEVEVKRKQKEVVRRREEEEKLGGGEEGGGKHVEPDENQNTEMRTGSGRQGSLLDGDNIPLIDVALTPQEEGEEREQGEEEEKGDVDDDEGEEVAPLPCSEEGWRPHSASLSLRKEGSRGRSRGSVSSLGVTLQVTISATSGHHYH